MPEMLQTEPPHKKQPSQYEHAPAYNPKQVREEAVAKVARLMDDCKALLNQNLGQKEVISSFSMVIKPDFRDQIVAIYNAIVGESNFKLHEENAPFHLKGELQGESFYFVAGYCDRKAGSQAIPAAEESSAAIAETRPLSDDEKKKLAVPPEALASMKPDELTDAQWEVLGARIDANARKVYDRRFEFLSMEKKLDVIRRTVSPHTEEGSSLGIVYSASSNTHKAAETLSDLRGDCDDLSILYIACINRLQSGGKMDVKEIRLATMNYFDPKEVKDPTSLSAEEQKAFDPMTNGIMGHANVLQIMAKSNEAKNPEETIFLVDLTYRSQTKELGPEAGYDDLKKKVLDYMNDGRNEKKISESLFDMRLYYGSAAVDVYFHEAKGLQFLAEKKYEEAIGEFDAAIGAAKKAKQDYSSPLALKVAALDNLTTQKSILGKSFLEKNQREAANEEFEKAQLFLSKSHESYNELPSSLDNLSSEAARQLSFYMHNNFGEGGFEKVKMLLLGSITKVPFKNELYVTLWDMEKWNKDYREAAAIFTQLKTDLDKLDSSKAGAIAEIKIELEGYAKEAQSKSQ